MSDTKGSQGSDDGDRSYRFSVGQRVYDRDKEGQTSMVIVSQPGETAKNWDIPGTGQTVADFNEGYDPEALVCEVAFEQNLSDTLSEWESMGPEDLRNAVKDASVKTYTYPESRLFRETATLPDNIQTYHELICYQNARLIQLAAGVSHAGFLWKRYNQLKDGEYEMASITKEDKYQLKEDFGVCIYCKEETETTFDHVIPISEGGDDSISNQVPACQACNSSKSNRDVIEWCKERGEPVPRIVWGKYLKQYREQLQEDDKLHKEIPTDEREKWDGVELQRNITERIHKRETDGRR
ncbi:HNH endonuclease [Halosimplex halobium]|uniref:HNH endonuclease n=1 Tax=Halosimplex halobium TaxID=3396618 RepID=UPI003F54ED71